MWAFAFANLAGIQAAPEGYPLAYAVKAGERWFLRSSFLLSIPEPGPGQKRQGKGSDGHLLDPDWSSSLSRTCAGSCPQGKPRRKKRTE